MKGGIQIHGSLDSQVEQQQPTTQATAISVSKMSRNSSKVVIEENDRENIPAEECIESKAYRINNIVSDAQNKDGVPVRQLTGPMSSRSGDATKKQ